MGIFTMLLALMYIFCLSFSFIAHRCAGGTGRMTGNGTGMRRRCLSSLTGRPI